MTREEVIKLVEGSDLDDATKTAWVKRITEGGLTQDVIDGIKDALQSEIDAGFEKLGVDISDSPEYKEREAQMVKEVEAIKADLDQKMAKNSQMLSDLQSQASDALDTLKAEEVKASIE